MPPPDYHAPMSLSDLLDRTARLTGKVLTRGIILGVVTMLPAGIVWGFALREILAAFADTLVRMRTVITPNLNTIAPLLFGIVEFAVALLMFTMGTLILQASMIDVTDAEMHSAPRTWQGAFSRGWHAAFIILGQYFVFFFIVVTGIVSLMLVAALFQQAIVAILLILAGVVAGVWLFVSWSLAAQSVVCEHYGVISGMTRSRLLIHGQWWRVFGILLLLGILSQFAVMLITIPFQGFAFASVLPDILDLERQMLSDPTNTALAEPILLKLSGIGWQLGLLQALSAVLTGIVTTVYSTLLYYDLRSRSGDFNDEHPAEQP